MMMKLAHIFKDRGAKTLECSYLCKFPNIPDVNVYFSDPYMQHRLFCTNSALDINDKYFRMCDCDCCTPEEKIYPL